MKRLKVIAISMWLYAMASMVSAAGPEERLQSTVGDLLDFLYESKSSAERSDPETEKTVREIIERDFSFETIARQALGREWLKLEDSEREEFVDLFSTLLIRTYTERFSGASRPSVEWSSGYQLKKARMEIPSVVNVDGDDFDVAYRLINQDGSWSVYDVIIEGVSLVGNYRSQFRELLTKGDFPRLMETLREKVFKS